MEVGIGPAHRHVPIPTSPGVSRAVDGRVFRPPDPGCAHHSDRPAHPRKGSRWVRRPVPTTVSCVGAADFEMFRYHPGGGGFGVPAPARGGLSQLLVRGADRLEPVHHSFGAGRAQSLSGPRRTAYAEYNSSVDERQALAPLANRLSTSVSSTVHAPSTTRTRSSRSRTTHCRYD